MAFMVDVQSAAVVHCSRSRFRCSLVVPDISSQLCLDACNDLQRVERLRDIIVCTQCQPCDLIHIFRFGSQHNQRKQMLFPNFPAEGEAVQIRKHHVQQCQCNGLGVCNMQSLCGTGSLFHQIAFVFQVDLHKVCNFCFIIDNQYHFCHSFSPNDKIQLYYSIGLEKMQMVFECFQIYVFW